MLRIFDYQILPTDTGKTILEYLTERGYSRAVVVHLKKTPESILLNGTWAYVTARLCPQDWLRIILSEPGGSPGIEPVRLPLAICYEDEDILVINKPDHMPIHPSQRHHEDTLANAVCGYFHEKGVPCTFRCVNRLDRDTTGLVIIARHMLSSAILNQALKNRAIHREYLAIAEGEVPESGTINAPIGRKSGSTIERTVDFLNGETAITHYRRLFYRDGLSLISLHLETGRTHQIRVHMSDLGHPLIGDFLYHPAFRTAADTQGTSSAGVSYAQIKRQALHSYRLQFTHPITGIPMDFSAPLPDDMAAFFPEFNAL